jgi:hypothetical protein
MRDYILFAPQKLITQRFDRVTILRNLKIIWRKTPQITFEFPYVQKRRIQQSNSPQNNLNPRSYYFE